MTNRIDRRLALVKSNNGTAIVPYITVGYPTIDLSIDIVKGIIRSGADIVELGIPFSDPLADGPTIQMTNFKALGNGANLRSAIELLRLIRKDDLETPIIFMGYYNPFLNHGTKDLLREAALSGLDGLIVPDLPLEESSLMVEECKSNDIHFIPLLSPTSTDERISLACRQAGGFIYCVSLTGVTGARKKLSSWVQGLVDRIRKHTDLPVLVGFGITSRADVLEIGKFADGAVVGSALLDAISNAELGEEVETASGFVGRLASKENF